MRLTGSAAAATFLPRYALANLGAHIGFMPLIILLLPRRVEAIAPSNAVELLSWLLLTGAVTASLAHIAAGHAGDRWLARHGNRRGLIAIGLGSLVGAYLLLGFARSPPMLIAALVAFQLALNLMFAPLGALLADHVADSRKGTAAGLLNLALPLSGLVVTLLGLLSGADSALPFLAVALLVTLLVAPLLVGWPNGLALVSSPVPGEKSAGSGLLRNFGLAFAARLLIQLGAAAVLGYLYFYVEGVARESRDFSPASASEGVARLSLIATFTSLVAGLAGGYASDRLGRRILPLVAAALLCSIALAALALLDDWQTIIVAYAAFIAALTAFLSIDSALVAQLLGNEPRRGALLGLMNLTNTLPAIVAPALTLAYGGLGLSNQLFEALLLTTAGAALVAAGLIALIRLR